MPRSLWLISYDISSPKRLRKMHRRCAAIGWQLQKSVFVFELTSTERQTLCRELAQLIDARYDRLLCLPFDTPPGSFHHGPTSNLLLVQADPRLEGFVF